jgi:hypothetical protein
MPFSLYINSPQKREHKLHDYFEQWARTHEKALCFVRPHITIIYHPKLWCCSDQNLADGPLSFAFIFLPFTALG